MGHLSNKRFRKILFQKAPEIFNASIALRKKADVLPRIKDGIFCWNEFFFAKARIFCGCYLGNTIYPNWYYLYDLRQPPEEIVSIMDNREELRNKVDSSPRFIRICKGNRSPIFLEQENALIDQEYKSIGIKELEKRYKYLIKYREELSVRLRDIAQEKIEEKNQFDQELKQPEENLYGLMFEINKERKKMKDFNLAKELSDKKKIFNNFKNEEVKMLAKMKLYEDLSEDDFCKVLSKKEFNRLKKRIANYLLDTSNNFSPFTKIPEQLARLDTLKLYAENAKNDKKSEQLQELDNYLVKMMNDYEQYR